MTKTEFFNLFNDEISQRWMNFKLTNKQMADWFDALSGFDVEMLCVAVSCHYIEDAPRQPSLKNIIARAKQAFQNASVEHRVVVMECVSAGRYKVGVKFRVNVMGRSLTDEKLADKMTELVFKFGDIYEGRWFAKIENERGQYEREKTYEKTTACD